MTGARRTTILGAAAFALALVPAALTPIRSYDLFWHLATGRWIVEHRALPIHDPFSIASDPKPWINGEWLFQILLYACGSIETIAWLKAVAIAALFAVLFAEACRHVPHAIALGLATLAFAGAIPTLDARPSAAGAAMLAVALLVLQRERRSLDAAFVLVTILWVNLHPTALLAPALALAFRRLHWLPAASGAALLVNPHGLEGVLAPIRLTAFARSGTFVNAEWLPSSPRTFPLLFVALVIGVALLAASRRSAARIAVFALLGYLAVAHVRNQSLFFVAVPILLAPEIADLLDRRRIRFTTIGVVTACAVSAALYGWVLRAFEQYPGLAARRFPREAVARLLGTGLRGHVYNPDQFGGFLIWSFYPERRTLTDGRNELHHAYIEEYASARLDSRAWRALLKKYRIDLAVDEYRPPLEVIDPRTGKRQMVPASLAYWPKRDWALIAYDEAGMVFARRAAFRPETIARLEMSGPRPDAGRGR